MNYLCLGEVVYAKIFFCQRKLIFFVEVKGFADGSSDFFKNNVGDVGAFRSDYRPHTSNYGCSLY